MNGKQPEPQHHWNFWTTILTTLITTIGTVTVAYITVIKPDTKEVAETEARKVVEERTLVRIKASLNPEHNNTDKPLLVWGYCNATRDNKSLSAETGETLDKMRLAQSSSGKGRINVSFVVPPNWYYRIDYRKVDGIGCSFSGWLI